MSTKKGLKLLHWRDEEDCNQPDDGGSQLTVKTPEGPFLEVYFIIFKLHIVNIVK